MEHIDMSQFDVANERPNRPWLVTVGVLPPALDKVNEARFRCGATTEGQGIAFWLLPVKPEPLMEPITQIISNEVLGCEFEIHNLQVPLDEESGRCAYLIRITDIPWLASHLGMPPPSPNLDHWSRHTPEGDLVQSLPMSALTTKACVDWLVNKVPVVVDSYTLFPRHYNPQRHCPKGTPEMLDSWVKAVLS